MQILVIDGVDITPFIAHKGYVCAIEDLDASAERSMSGVLTRDRVARVPTISVQIRAMLSGGEVQKILNACKKEKIYCSYFNFETQSVLGGYFYAKVKAPNIYSIHNNLLKYEGFSIDLKGFEGVSYA